MVWRFTPDNLFSGLPSFNVYSTGVYTIGRLLDCDINIDDASGSRSGVSRMHAELIIEEMRSFEADPTFSGVRIRDLSKKGTKIDRKGVQLIVKETHDHEMELKHGDVITFGNVSAKYRFGYDSMKFYLCGAPSTQGVSSIGALITQDSSECTHLLVDNGMPVNEAIIDAVLTKKPIIESTWLEFVVEKKICFETTSGDSYAGYIPSLSLDGTCTKVVGYKARRLSLAGQTFALHSEREYKFPLQSLLQLCGSDVLDVDSEQESKDVSNWVFVVPSTRCTPKIPAKFIQEIDLVRSVLSGILCPSSIKEPLRLMEIDPSSASTLSDSDLVCSVSSGIPCPSSNKEPLRLMNPTSASPLSDSISETGCSSPEEQNLGSGCSSPEELPEEQNPESGCSSPDELPEEQKLDSVQVNIPKDREEAARMSVPSLESSYSSPEEQKLESAQVNNANDREEDARMSNPSLKSGYSSSPELPKRGRVKVHIAKNREEDGRMIKKRHT